MTFYESITPTTKILDECGRDWTWAFVLFRPIEGFPNYCVTTEGIIWSQLLGGKRNSRKTGSWHKLALRETNSGYIRCELYKFDRIRPYYFRVHTLVLNSFMSERLNGTECRHINGNRHDNRITNIKWSTHEENMNDRSSHGKSPFGSKHALSKLIESDIYKIIELYDNGRGLTQQQIGDKFGVHRMTVGKILNGKRWKHVTENDGINIKTYNRNIKKIGRNNIKSIFEMYVAGEAMLSIARKFDVDKTTIYSILKRETYKDIKISSDILRKVNLKINQTK